MKQKTAKYAHNAVRSQLQDFGVAQDLAEANCTALTSGRLLFPRLFPSHSVSVAGNGRGLTLHLGQSFSATVNESGVLAGLGMPFYRIHAVVSVREHEDSAIGT